MEVIRHQDIGMQRAAKALGQLGEMLEKELRVLVREEASLAVVAALNNVHRQARGL
jgi:hypothetical protein